MSSCGTSTQQPADVYRLNEAKEIRNDVSFDLHRLLERTASGFSHVVNNKGILFDCDFRDTEVRLYGCLLYTSDAADE
mgnify:CR=1 FL=1